MKANPIGYAVPLALALVTFIGAHAPRAADTERHKLGDHPAVVVQRLQRNATYDYASKFYPHPAWLYLHPTQVTDPLDARLEKDRKDAMALARAAR